MLMLIQPKHLVLKLLLIHFFDKNQVLLVLLLQDLVRVIIKTTFCFCLFCLFFFFFFLMKNNNLLTHIHIHIHIFSPLSFFFSLYLFFFLFSCSSVSLFFFQTLQGNEENGFAAKFAKLKYAVVIPFDYFSEISDPRTYLGQQLGVLGPQANALLSVVPAQQQQFLRQCCQQAGVNLWEWEQERERVRVRVCVWERWERCCRSTLFLFFIFFQIEKEEMKNEIGILEQQGQRCTVHIHTQQARINKKE